MKSETGVAGRTRPPGTTSRHRPSAASPQVTGPPPPAPGAPAQPRQGLVAAVAELWRARELTANLVRRDLKVRHRGSFLGMLWSLATPLLIVALYWFIFTFIFKQSPASDVARADGQKPIFAIYFFAGLTIWNFFSSAVGASTGSVTGAGYLLNKVYFPRAILPLSTVLSSLVTFLFEFSVLLAAAIVSLGLPSVDLVWMPVIVGITALLAFGFALLLSAVTVFLRDVAHFVGVFMQLWFWGTPVIYSLQFVAGRPGLVRLLKLNPVTGLVVSFRNIVVLDHPPALRLLAYDAGAAVVMVAVGAWAFGRWQRVFSEIV
ncbi:MAG TPA: ABC transporter permease [Acidimicrobiales bacterium]|jgi:ABC-type polysaccharide/polyol phosphate export permease|nr:ABC transporter permease [Acidimicrobiales bacterium]